MTVAIVFICVLFAGLLPAIIVSCAMSILGKKPPKTRGWFEERDW